MSERLRDEISMLGEMLGDVICQIHGPDSLELIEHIRTLSRDARGGDDAASDSLQSVLAGLSLKEMRLVIRAFSVFLDLTNLAEDRERIRTLEDRSRASAPEPRTESIGHAVRALAEAGETADALQRLVDQLDLELVLTAHPTEAKRRSLRAKLRSIREILYSYDDDRRTDREEMAQRLRAELVKLWQTDFIRPWRPSVLQEVERGLAVAPTMWEVIPALCRDLRDALGKCCPEHSFNVDRLFRYGSWIGGDRDGHPHVTADISAQTLTWLRDEAIRLHLSACEDLAESFSMSQRQSSVSDELLAAIAAAQSSWPELVDHLASVPPDEVYRRHLHVIHWRLQRTGEVKLDRGAPSGSYRSASELRDDVQVIADSLRAEPTAAIAQAEVQPWIDRISAFGFHLARLDVRQDSGLHLDVMDELFKLGGAATDFAECDELARQRLLVESLGQSMAWDESQLSDEARETLSLFRLLRRAARRYGMEAFGGHVISMTRAPSDLLIVLWLWHWSAGVDGGDPRDGELRLPIIPLFETVDDLTRSASTTDALLSSPVYREYLAGLGDRQTIMVGYSDSTKDGGYLAACWALYRAQREMFDVTEQHGVQLTFFHGRGGSLGRGGGPAARAIRSLPTRTFCGSLRLTEQGEVLAERYDDPRIASRHLEQLAWSALLSAAQDHDHVEVEWTAAMEFIARQSRVAYRHLIDHDGFVDFFRLVTPIREIEQLPIGSRPSRRKGGHGLKDLRAIPWVFSWTQVRCLVPAWFGIGAAIDELAKHDPDSIEYLRQMYVRWPFARAWVDNAALALAKTDLGVMNRYADLAGDNELLEVIADEIADEFAATKRALATIIDEPEMLSNVAWLEESIRVRNRYVDPLNLIQVELLKRSRGQPDDSLADEYQQLLRLSIKGVAAGMRTTG
ncbi:MAG: phosphoenolpyruvate carboxylase [Pirellulaceae bacterium]|nr:phosphoenolpyruvate carboxylase [Pirellulaceae bacterium]